MKVLVKEKIADSGVEALRKEFEVDVCPEMTQEELREKIKEYDALIVRSATKVTKEIIDQAENLKIIGRAGIGVDNVDVEAATKKGIIVANAPQSNIISAAEHAIALLLTQCRNIPQANTSLKSGKWERSKFEGVELYEKTLGILGLGKIGTLVAQRALSFEMKLIAYDPYMSKERAAQLGVRLIENLDDFLKEADFITVHLPKTPETMGMIGAREIGLMKNGVRIVNAARGGIINEDDLAEAIKSGKVASAGLDVFSKEPCMESPLFALDQVVVTPHLGASTQEAQDKAGVTIAEQVLAALKGEFVSYAVNLAAGGIDDSIKPFLPLAEKLGKLFGYLVEGHISKVEMEFAGQISQFNTKILTIAILKGFFEPISSEPVTYVNAPMVAKERGISTVESKTSTSRDYVNLITVRASNSKGEVTAAATLTGKKNEERFVGIYGYDIDMAPSKYMAFFRYKDVPGMIGKVGTVLGDNGINIANMHVGRKKVAGEAVMGLNVDAPIPDEIMEKIKEIAGIPEAKFIVL
ncbi:MAG: phosphoglycerate dehydrogenase [Actinobacteria bacterium]|nr:phosphoglycerate dehydrogenase [Actinomycetota bacterium]